MLYIEIYNICNLSFIEELQFSIFSNFKCKNKTYNQLCYMSFNILVNNTK